MGEEFSREAAKPRRLKERGFSANLPGEYNRMDPGLVSIPPNHSHFASSRLRVNQKKVAMSLKDSREGAKPRRLDEEEISSLVVDCLLKLRVNQKEVAQ